MTVESNEALTLTYRVMVQDGQSKEAVGRLFVSLEQAQAFHTQCVRFAGEGVGRKTETSRSYSIQVLGSED